MNVNMAQLNNENLEKITLKVNNETNPEEFQNVLTCLLEMSTSVEIPTEENRIFSEMALNEQSMIELSLPKKFLEEPTLTKTPLTELPFKVDNDTLKMLFINENNNHNCEKVELSQANGFEKLLTKMQTELGVKEIVASTELKDMEFTHQSYNNMLKIKFKDDVNEKKEFKIDEIVKKNTIQVEEIDKIDKIEISEKVTGLRKAIENNEKRKNIDFKIEDDKLVKLESPLSSKMENNTMKSLEDVKTIINNHEVKEAMVESIKEAQINGVSKVKVLLKPKEMGSVEIEIKMENGKMKGEIKVLNTEVKNQIEQLIIPIKGVLKEQNIILKDFQVIVFNQSSEGEFSNNQHTNAHQHRYEPEFVDYHYEEVIQEKLEINDDGKGLNLLA